MYIPISKSKSGYPLRSTTLEPRFGQSDLTDNQQPRFSYGTKNFIIRTFITFLTSTFQPWLPQPQQTLSPTPSLCKPRNQPKRKAPKKLRLKCKCPACPYSKIR